jgi:uroporphyrin-3 C-methyltransferase
MSDTESKPAPDALEPPAASVALLAPEPPAVNIPRASVHWSVWLLAVLALAALGGNALLWQKVTGMQEQLAKQSAQSLTLSNEARALAKEAQSLAREAAAKTSLQEARVAELTLQRSQYDELMRSLSRSRDESLLVDTEATLRLAQQQAQLTGSVAPLLAALKNVDQRIVRAAQPNLAPLQRAIAADIEHVKTFALSDTPAILIKLDDVARRVDQLPLANAVAAQARTKPSQAVEAPAGSAWWVVAYYRALAQLKDLVRVSRIDVPDAALLSPDQAFFLRENLKIKLLNVRMALLGRQVEQARDELEDAQALTRRYFDPDAMKTKTALELLKLIQSQLQQLEVPRIDQTLAVLAAATAGR